MTPRDWSAALLRPGRTWRRTALGIVIALVGGTGAIAFVVATRFRFEALPFVLVILVATLVGKRIAGAVAVVVATLLLDYYALPPLHQIDPETPTEFWGLVSFAAVMLLTAQLVGWLEGVGDRERVERERVSLLVAVGDAVSSAGELDRGLREMARVLVPGFADWAVVHVAREDGSVERVAAVHREGERLERALLAAPELSPDADGAAAAVIRTGRPEAYVAPPIEQLRSMTPDDMHLDLVLRAGLGSSVVAPLTARERTFGALTVARSPRRAAFSDRDVALLEEIGERSALVADNLRLAELERRSAGRNAVLQELTAALSASVTPAEVGRTVVEQGARAMGAAAAAFAIRRPDGAVELREHSGHDAEAIEAVAPFSIHDPLPMSQAMRTGRPIVIRSIEERDRRFPGLRGVPPLEDHALVCLPFVVRGGAIGGLAASFGEPRSFAPWELSFMESIAAQAGQALDRAMLFESERAANSRLETSAARLERLLMVAYRLSRARDRTRASRWIVDAGARAADASSGALLLVDGSTDELVVEASFGTDEAVAGSTRFPLSAPFAGAEAARTGHPVWVSGPEDWSERLPAGSPSELGGARPVSLAALPLVVAGNTLGALALGYDAEHRFDEEERDFLLTLAGLCAQSLQGALVLEEREAARAEAEEARERIGFLAEATRLLSSSLDVRATISELANLCVPRIADWMSLAVLEGNEVRRLALRHADQDKVEAVVGLGDRLPLPPGVPTLDASVLRTGESELVEGVDDELLKRIAPDPEALEAIRELGLSSVATVPLVVQDRVLGVLSVAHAESERHYDRRDLTFLESLARRAAVAIENSRLFRDREQMARALQRSLLPRRLPSIPGVELAVRYLPFGQGHDVGGDFYDVFSGLDGSWGLMIGDVCGKGPEAAAIVGIARHTVRGLAMAHSRPSSILEALNHAILDESPWDRFCTACYVRLRPDGPSFRATVALGGHLPPLVLSRDGTVGQVGQPGSLLGVLDQPELSDAVFELSPGDVLLMYTDGLEEPGSIAAGFPSVQTVLARSAGRTADAIADELLERFSGERGSPPRDDVAILAVRVADPQDETRTYPSESSGTGTPETPS
jgi:GAF domain-containing protein